MHKILFTITIIAALVASQSVTAHQNSSETNPIPTAEITREQRTSSSSQLRGEADWTFINYSTSDFVVVTRIDSDGDRSDAELLIYLMSDPDMIEDATGMYYEGSFRVRFGACEGVELYDDGLTLYLAMCADDEYVNMVMGTDRRDVLDVIETMQEGDVPTAPRGYIEEND